MSGQYWNGTAWVKQEEFQRPAPKPAPKQTPPKVVPRKGPPARK